MSDSMIWCEQAQKSSAANKHQTERANKMGFGKAAKQNKPTGSNVDTAQLFMNIKTGTRIFRLVGDEVRVRKFWLAKDTDGWRPRFGFNPNDKRPAIPVIIGVFDPSVGEYGEWSKGTWENPITDFLDGLGLEEEERKGMYAKESFYVNVLDRTMIKVDGDTIVYPDTKNQFPANLKSIVAKPANAIRILEGSSGKCRDDDGEIVGKSMYSNLLRVVEGGEVDPDTGNILTPDQYDIRMVVSGKGIDTNRALSITANRDVIDFSQYQVYDLESWLRPLPFEAQDALLNGAEWKDVIEEYNVTMYPSLIGGEVELPF
jgi:hypothetical protein